MKIIVRLAYLAPVIVCASCATVPPAAPPAKPAAPAASTDINKLAQIVMLPRHPQQAVWRHSSIGTPGLGPADYSLRAVFLFSPADLKAFTSRPATPPQIAEARVEAWFPTALKKAARGAGATATLRCRKLDASGFFKGSLQNGSLLQPVGTEYLILSLFTT